MIKDLKQLINQAIEWAVISDQNPGCFGYIGDEILPNYRDYNKPFQGSLLTKQDSMECHSHKGLDPCMVYIYMVYLHTFTIKKQPFMWLNILYESHGSYCWWWFKWPGSNAMEVRRSLQSWAKLAPTMVSWHDLIVIILYIHTYIYIFIVNVCLFIYATYAYIWIWCIYLSICLYNVFTYLHVSSNPFACLFDTVDLLQARIRLTFIPVILKVHLYPSHGQKIGLTA